MRHPNPRLAKIHRNYAVEEVASLFGVHMNTVQGWLKQGLLTTDDKRPTLILGPPPFCVPLAQCGRRASPAVSDAAAIGTLATSPRKGLAPWRIERIKADAMTRIMTSTTVNVTASGVAKKDAEPYAGLCVRSDGRHRLFQAYASRREAESAAARPRQVGCPATVETA